MAPAPHQPLLLPSGWEATSRKRLLDVSMRSANGSCWNGMPAVHGSLAMRTFHPAGYETVNPCTADVYDSVNAGGADGLGAGDGVADGLGDSAPPMSGVVPGRTTATPIAPMAITATAATANLAYLFMGGNLHGTRTSTRRCGVMSIVARASRSTQSGAAGGASVS